MQILNLFGLRLRGEARIRLIDTRVISELRKRHSSWPEEEIRRAMLDRIDYDTGWQKNTITDAARRLIAGGSAFGSNLDIFIHQGLNPSNTLTNMLQYIFSSQSPDQIRTPDSSTFNATTLVQTRTVQFPAPAVARSINIAGLTTQTATTTSQNLVAGIAAYTLLSSTVEQSISQAADVQYRVTFSLDGV